MVEGKGKTLVFEVFLNLNEILAHHRRMLRSFFTRLRDQHTLFQSVAGITLNSTFIFREHASSSLTALNIRRTPVHAEYESYIKLTFIIGTS